MSSAGAGGPTNPFTATEPDSEVDSEYDEYAEREASSKKYRQTAQSKSKSFGLNPMSSGPEDSVDEVDEHDTVIGIQDMYDEMEQRVLKQTNEVIQGNIKLFGKDDGKLDLFELEALGYSSSLTRKDEDDFLVVSGLLKRYSEGVSTPDENKYVNTLFESTKASTSPLKPAVELEDDVCVVGASTHAKLPVSEAGSGSLTENSDILEKAQTELEKNYADEESTKDILEADGSAVSIIIAQGEVRKTNRIRKKKLTPEFLTEDDTKRKKIEEQLKKEEERAKRRLAAEQEAKGIESRAGTVRKSTSMPGRTASMGVVHGESHSARKFMHALDDTSTILRTLYTPKDCAKKYYCYLCGLIIHEASNAHFEHVKDFYSAMVRGMLPVKGQNPEYILIQRSLGEWAHTYCNSSAKSNDDLTNNSKFSGKKEYTDNWPSQYGASESAVKKVLKKIWDNGYNQVTAESGINLREKYKNVENFLNVRTPVVMTRVNWSCEIEKRFVDWKKYQLAKWFVRLSIEDWNEKGRPKTQAIGEKIASFFSDKDNNPISLELVGKIDKPLRDLMSKKCMYFDKKNQEGKQSVEEKTGFHPESISDFTTHGSNIINFLPSEMSSYVRKPGTLKRGVRGASRRRQQQQRQYTKKRRAKPQVTIEIVPYRP